MRTLNEYIKESLLDDEDELIKNSNDEEVKLISTFGNKYYDFGYVQNNNIIYTELRDSLSSKSQYFEKGLSGEFIDDVYKMDTLYNKKYKISNIVKYPIHISEINNVYVNNDTFDIDNSKLSIDKISRMEVLINTVPSNHILSLEYKNIKKISNLIIDIKLSNHISGDIIDSNLGGAKIIGANADNLILKWLLIDRKKFYDEYGYVKPNPELFEYFDYIFKENNIQNLYISTMDMANGKNIAYQVIKKSKDGYKYKKVRL